jgi:hypothetical protein
LEAARENKKLPWGKSLKRFKKVPSSSWNTGGYDSACIPRSRGMSDTSIGLINSSSASKEEEEDEDEDEERRIVGGVGVEFST